MRAYKKPEIEIILMQHLMQSELTASGYEGETTEVEAKPNNDPFIYDLWEDNTDNDWLSEDNN